MTEEEFEKQRKQGFWIPMCSVNGRIGISDPPSLEECAREMGISPQEALECIETLIDHGSLIPVVEGQVPYDVLDAQIELDENGGAGGIALPLVEWRETGRLKKVEKAVMLLALYMIPDTDGALDFKGRTLPEILIQELPEVKTKRQARKTIQRLVQNGWIEKQNGQYRFII